MTNETTKIRPISGPLLAAIVATCGALVTSIYTSFLFFTASFNFTVIPLKRGICKNQSKEIQIPAFAGMTTVQAAFFNSSFKAACSCAFFCFI
jgi:hypothetical protein